MGDPAFGVTEDAGIEPVAFPAVGVGGDALFIDIVVSATARGCRIRWPYVRIPASNGSTTP